MYVQDTRGLKHYRQYIQIIINIHKYTWGDLEIEAQVFHNDQDFQHFSYLTHKELLVLWDWEIKFTSIKPQGELD